MSNHELLDQVKDMIDSIIESIIHPNMRDLSNDARFCPQDYGLAIMIAENVHRDQSYGILPYMYHLKHTAFIAW